MITNRQLSIQYDMPINEKKLSTKKNPFILLIVKPVLAKRSTIMDKRNMAGNSNRRSSASTGMGLNSPTVPMPRQMLKTLLPITLPTEISCCPLAPATRRLSENALSPQTLRHARKNYPRNINYMPVVIFSGILFVMPEKIILGISTICLW